MTDCDVCPQGFVKQLLFIGKEAFGEVVSVDNWKLRDSQLDKSSLG